MLKIKKLLFIALMSLFLTGCNYEMLDLKYEFNYAYCDYEYLPKEIIIKSWTDYDGEQLQITDEKDNVLLVSSYHCIMTKNRIDSE